MIDVGNYYFACDECPISEGVEHRLRAAKEGGYDPQFEYCGCDKVQTEFFIKEAIYYLTMKILCDILFR